MDTNIYENSDWKFVKPCGEKLNSKLIEIQENLVPNALVLVLVFSLQQSVWLKNW